MKKTKRLLALVLSVMMLGSMCAVTSVFAVEPETPAYTVTDSSVKKATMLDWAPIPILGTMYGAGKDNLVNFSMASTSGTAIAGFHALYFKTFNVTDTKVDQTNFTIGHKDGTLSFKSKATTASTGFVTGGGNNRKNHITLYSWYQEGASRWKSNENHVIEFDLKADTATSKFGVTSWNLWGNREDEENPAPLNTLLDSNGKIRLSDVDYPVDEWFRLRLEYHADTNSNYYWYVYMKTKDDADFVPVFQDEDGNCVPQYANSSGFDYNSRFATDFIAAQTEGAELAGYAVDNFKHIQGYEITKEEIIAPEAEHICEEETVKFQASVQGASTVKFRLDGKLMNTFTATNDEDLLTYTTNLDMTDVSYGIHNFEVEKYDADGKLIGTISKTVNLTALYQDFLNVYPTTISSPYDYNKVDFDGNGEIIPNETGYPLEKRAVSEFAPSGNTNPYIFETIVESTTEATYENTDNDDKKDEIYLRNKNKQNEYDYNKNYIKLININRNLKTDGGILEIKLKMKIDKGSTAVTILGLPMWQTYSTSAITCHYFVSGGYFRGTDVPCETDTWIDVKLHHDIDNQTWTVWKGDTKIMNKLPLNDNSKVSSIQMHDYKELGIGIVNESTTNTTGVHIKEIGVSRLKKANATGVVTDSADGIAKEINIPETTAKVTINLGKGYDALTDANVKFLYNGEEKAVTGINYTANATTLEVPVPTDVTLAPGDKVYIAIKPEAQIGKMTVNKEIGANLDVYEVAFKLKEFDVDGTDATVNVYNGTNAEKTGKLYIASYNSDNELVGLYVDDADYVSGALSLDNIVNAKITEGSYYKAMFWDGETLEPHATFIDYTVPNQD